MIRLCCKMRSMSQRIQVTAPDAVVERWRERAEAAGVSLSTWVVLQVERPDTAEHLERMTSAAEDMQRTTSALLAVLGEAADRKTKGGK